MNTPARKACVVHVKGIVQGVGFRYATVFEARRLQVTGYVRNASDGSVETLAEGAERDVAAFLAWLKQGPPGAVVREVTTEERPYTGGYDRFTVED
jgi:acylphosphatase